MADDRNPSFIDGLVGHQIIDSSVQSPGPGGDRSPVVRARLASFVSEKRLDTALGGAGPIWRDVAIVNRGHGVAPINRLVQGPDVELGTASRLGRVVVRDARTAAVHPTRR